MHPVNVRQTLKTMRIVVDTREQKTDRAERRYASFGCRWHREKLDFGDYSAEVTLPNGETFSLSSLVCIERKFGIDELTHCYCQDRKRFVREFERAKEAGAKLYLLVENGSLDEAYSGHYRAKVHPKSLTASMLAWLARYNCQILFCSAENSGQVIHDVLYRELKERLEGLPDEPEC